MDPDTFRGDVGVPDPDVYWRRRVSVLTALLIVVAVVVWACTRKSDEPAAVAGGGKTPAAASAREAAAPDGSSAARPAADAAAAVTPTPRAERRSDGLCRKEDLVVHLARTQEVYGADAKPRFLVMLVNTGEGDCMMDVGPRSLEMRITSGPDRVWSSADCVSGDSKQLRRLERGVPFVRTIDWNRRRSGRDCAASHPMARAGTYVATAIAGSESSSQAVFHLR